MNPAIAASIIDDAIADDPESASAEYCAEFRSDISDFISRDVVRACTVEWRTELLQAESRRYVAFVDPSGGSSDSMTLAIAHADRAQNGQMAVLDAIREIRPPFSPESAVLEFVALLRSYRIRVVTGDRYGGQWPREQFRKHGIEYRISDRTKSDLYRDCLPLLNSRSVELLDIPRLASQICGLERRTARGGRDSIDHPRGAHDDLANAALGALLLTKERVALSINPEAIRNLGRVPAGAWR